MKISKMTFTATIPTGQYANIQPSFEITDIEDEVLAIKKGIEYIELLYAKYSSIGELREHKIVVKSSSEKINDLLG